jgi:hypothetical protein
MSLVRFSIPSTLLVLLVLLWFVGPASPSPTLRATLDPGQASLCDLYMYQVGTPEDPNYHALCRYNGCPETKCAMSTYTTFVPGGYVDVYWCSCDGAQNLCCHIEWHFENGEGIGTPLAVGACRPAAGPGYCPIGGTYSIHWENGEAKYAECPE